VPMHTAKGPSKNNVTWLVGSSGAKKVPGLVRFFLEFFCRIFLLHSPRNAQKRTKNKSRKKYLGLVGSSKVHQIYAKVRHFFCLFEGPLHTANTQALLPPQYVVQYVFLCKKKRLRCLFRVSVGGHAGGVWAGSADASHSKTRTYFFMRCRIPLPAAEQGAITAPGASPLR
jgi:hypothetical protein